MQWAKFVKGFCFWGVNGTRGRGLCRGASGQYSSFSSRLSRSKPSVPFRAIGATILIQLEAQTSLTSPNRSCTMFCCNEDRSFFGFFVRIFCPRLNPTHPARRAVSPPHCRDSMFHNNLLRSTKFL